MTAQPLPHCTPQEYYLLEHQAAFKSEYYNGEIFAMAGASANHVLIATNFARELGNRLLGGPCKVFSSDLRIKVESTGLRTYPDVSVICGALQADSEDPAGQTYTNPTAVIEVLSPSTEAYDRGFKAENYRTIKSLKAYVLVSQDRQRAEIFERQPEGQWNFSEVSGPDATLQLPPLGIAVPLAGIYAGVVLPPYQPPRHPDEATR